MTYMPLLFFSFEYRPVDRGFYRDEEFRGLLYLVDYRRRTVDFQKGIGVLPCQRPFLPVRKGGVSDSLRFGYFPAEIRFAGLSGTRYQSNGFAAHALQYARVCRAGIMCAVGVRLFENIVYDYKIFKKYLGKILDCFRCAISYR